jgi:hypothetical protein
MCYKVPDRAGRVPSAPLIGNLFPAEAREVIGIGFFLTATEIDNQLGSRLPTFLRPQVI